MGKDSKIQWTDDTFNPWWGCEKVSPACAHCYAESWAKRTGHEVWGRGVPRIHWVIAGGESGPGARPMHPEWARGLRDQCVAAGVPFFFKQWGEWAPFMHSTRDAAVMSCLHVDGRQSPGREWHDAPEGTAMMCRVGKKAAGRLLDGREWSEFPTTA